MAKRKKEKVLCKSPWQVKSTHAGSFWFKLEILWSSAGNIWLYSKWIVALATDNMVNVYEFIWHIHSLSFIYLHNYTNAWNYW